QVYQPAYPGYWPPTYSSMFALGDTWYRTGLHNLIETSTDEGLSWVDRTPAVPQCNILSVSASAQFALGLLAPMRWAPVEWEDSSHTTVMLFENGETQPRLLRVPWFVSVGASYQRELQAGATNDALFITQAFSEAALIRSTDAGNSWESISLPGSLYAGHAIFPYFFNRDRGVILAAPQSSKTLYSVYTTNDGGVHWSSNPTFRMKLAQQSGSPFISMPVVRWLSRDTVILFDQNNFLQISVDGGENWELLSRNESIPAVVDISITSDGNGFVIAKDGSLFRTDDFGISYIQLRPAFAEGDPRKYYESILFHPQPDILGVADRIGQVQWTEDGGVSWREERESQRYTMSGGLRAISRDTAFVRLYAPEEDRSPYYRTDDGGGTWEECADITGTDIYKIAFVTPSLWYAFRTPTSNDSTAIRRSTDGGASWTPVLARMIPDKLMAGWTGVFHRGDRIYWFVSEQGIYETTDAGVTWNMKAAGLIPHSQGGQLDISQYPVCYLATADQFLKSSDAGASWTTILTYQNASRLLVPDADHVYLEFRPAGPYVRKLLRSLDGGQTWDSLTMAPGAYTIGRIDAEGSGPAIGSNASAFLRTHDFWQTAEVQDELYGHNTWEIQFLDADNGWVTTNRAILRTTNGGVNWTKASPVLPSSPRIVSTWPQPAASGSAMNTIIDLTQPG
ncbi:MAG: hypothetical protein WAV84_14845, partial [Bacteroidota bacterium]